MCIVHVTKVVGSKVVYSPFCSYCRFNVGCPRFVLGYCFVYRRNVRRRHARVEILLTASNRDANPQFVEIPRLFERVKVVGFEGCSPTLGHPFAAARHSACTAIGTCWPAGARRPVEIPTCPDDSANLSIPRFSIVITTNIYALSEIRRRVYFGRKKSKKYNNSRSCTRIIEDCRDSTAVVK